MKTTLILNFAFSGLLIALGFYGIASLLFELDTYYLTHTTFLIGTCLWLASIWIQNSEFERGAAEILVNLGLFGTVIGFCIALNGADLSLAGNAEDVPELLDSVWEGMGTALGTTLAGMFFALWMTIIAWIRDNLQTKGG